MYAKTIGAIASALLATGMMAFPGTAGAVTIAAGAVNANGTPQDSPTSFTVSHPSTGRYIITFNPGFSPAPQCVFQPIGTGARVGGLGETSTTCDVTFVTTGKRTKTVDILFNFVAVAQSP